MSFCTESKSWFKIQGVPPWDAQTVGVGEAWVSAAGALRWIPFSTPVSGNLWKIYLCFPSFFISALQWWRSSSAGCPCPCHVGSICCDGQRGLIAAGSPVSERSYVTAANAPLTLWDSAIKTAKTLQYFSPFLWDCNVSRGSNLLTTFILGTQKHCSTLTPLPGKMGLTFRNFCVSFSYFRVISMLSNMHSF